MSTTPIRTWHFSQTGKLVAGNVSVADMDEARAMAARWNRDETRPDMVVAIIANAPVVGCATAVTTVA